MEKQDEPELKVSPQRTFEIASLQEQQGRLTESLIHCAQKYGFKGARARARVGVHECTDLVATASSGKWRLLNTRAKAPSWDEKDAEQTQSLH